jgi:ABC-2 type transport system ATP-binding protein
MISIRDVSKRFGKRPAVNNLNLEIARGQILGLLGHNGAGKSTTIGMLLGQVYPEKGKVLINHVDVFANRNRALSRVGAIFEAPAFYDYLSGATNLKIFCEYTSRPDKKRMQEVVELVGLKDRIQDPVRTYSHGMRQRLALAQALLPNPELLILDEPSEGLDPEGIHEMRNLIVKLNREWGLTILFSSHLLSEVQQICSHLAVLQNGNLLFSGQWRQTENDEHWIKLDVNRQSEAEMALLKANLITKFGHDGHGQLSPQVSLNEVAAWLIQNSFELKGIAPIERTLEDFYLDLVQKTRAGN